MKTFYATFGFGQQLADNYVVVRAKDRNAAHEKMYDEYGPLWAFLYDESEYPSAILRFGLEQVAFGTKNWKVGGE